MGMNRLRLTQFRELMAPMRELRWQRLFGYVRPYRTRLIVALICLLFSTAAGLVLPLVAGRLVDVVAGVGDAFPLDTVVLGLIVVVVVQALFEMVETYQMAYLGERVVSDLRIEAYGRLQRLSLGFFAQRRVGEITSRLTNDVTLIQATVTSNVAALLGASVQFLGALVLMLSVSWQLTGLALVVVPIVMTIGLVFGRLLRRFSTRVQDRLADTSAVLEETVAGVRIVQSFGREPYELGRFRGTVEAMFATALERARIRAWFGPLISSAAWGAMIALLWVGGNMVVSGALRPGDLIALLLYAGSIAGTIGTFSGLFSQTQEALGAVTRVFELIDLEPEIANAPDAQPLPPLQGAIQFDRVSFRYSSEANALQIIDDLSLSIAPGEMVALVGPSGAGKSTIANLIPRFYEVSSGAIRLDGHDIRGVTLETLRAQIGIVPQETQLFSGSIAENIRYGDLDANDDAVAAAARAANAEEFIAALPQGYATAVGERGVKLSGGQRQRIAIARAILKNPQILILDEATSALDSASERAVQEALERLMVGRTSLVIAHRLSTVRRANRIAVIEQGRLIELGSHDQLLAAGGSYARLYSLQFADADTASERVILPFPSEIRGSIVAKG